MTLLVIGMCVCSFAAGAWWYSLPLDRRIRSLEDRLG